MYRVDIVSFGKVIKSKTFNENEFDDAKKFYRKYSHNVASFTPILYINGERIKFYKSDRMFDVVW